MFLTHLYRYRKRWLLLVLLLIACQLYINFKRGMVISPFYHYGMYSAVLEPQREYPVFEIWVDGKRLQGHRFAPWQWDQLHQPLEYFANIQANNRFYHAEVKRLASMLLISSNSARFEQPCRYTEFMQWYRRYLTRMLGHPVGQVEVTRRMYRFDGTLQPTHQTQHLSTLCR